MPSLGEAPPLVLASSSPARQKLLQDAGIRFSVMVSAVDEDAVLAQAQQQATARGESAISPAATAQLLATAKAREIAGRPESRGALVLGCDSVFELDGVAYGKPHTADNARERIRAMSGNTGVLHTGHCLIDCRAKEPSEATELRSASVHFDELSEQDIAEYVATEEPLWVAGSFTIDGFGAAFIKGIDGEFHTVVGLSVNALRHMLARHGLQLPIFWTNPA